MRRHWKNTGVLSLVAIMATIGCRPQQPFYLGDKKGGGDPSHYVGVATDIEYPDVSNVSLDEVTQAKPPLTVDNLKFASYWDLTLEQAVEISLANSTVLRNLGGAVAYGPSGPFGTNGIAVQPQLLLSVSAAGGPPTIYLPALAETDARSGVEAALSAFDAQFASSMLWEKNRTAENSNAVNVPTEPPVLAQDQGTFQAQLSQTNATGGTVTLNLQTQYEGDNIPVQFKQFPSAYTTNLQVQFKQPLLRGAGVEFNRIAGPAGTVSATGINNGILIARLRVDQSLADFEGSVRNVVSDVEKAYWNLYYAYRQLDTAIAGRDAGLESWKKVHARMVYGAAEGSAREEAQARQQYFVFRSVVEQSLNALFTTEGALRYMLGLSATDGRLIRPKDEPTTAKVDFDWCEAQNEAMVRSVELRKQKWIIKQRELEIISAKNWLLPQLDAVAQYQWQGFGHVLLDTDGNNSSSLSSLAAGDLPSWQLGFNLTIPLGFRRENSGVRNAELSLVKERKLLQDEELEVSHLLANAFRELAIQHQLSQTQYDRWAAAVRETKDAEVLYDAGRVTLDFVLDAQRRLADSEAAFYRAVVDYNLAIAGVHFRKGSLLEYDGVFLAEGPWPAKAYFDAQRRARASRCSALHQLRLHHAEGHQPRAIPAASGHGGSPARRHTDSCRHTRHDSARA